MAYYDPIKCSIYVLEDTEETSHFDVTKMGESNTDEICSISHDTIFSLGTS